MRRCYLHIGTAKTGSTTVQRFIHQHRRELLRSGVLAPISGTGPIGGHYPVVKALGGRPVPKSFVESPRELAEEIASHPDTRVIVSAEWLENYCRRNRRNNAVVEFFKGLGLTVVVLGYFRNQPQRLNSGYSQAVKSLQTDTSFEERADAIQASGKLDYTFWSEFAAENGCEFVARPFNSAVRSVGIIEDFLSTLGIESHGIAYDSENRANRSPGPCALAAVLEVMRLAKERRHRWTHRQRVHAGRLLSQLMDEPEFAEKPFCGLDTRAAREIQAFYRPCNDRFAGSMWGSDWATVFKEDVEAPFERNVFDPATASPEAKDLYAAILNRLWSGMQAIMNDQHLQKDRTLVPAETG